jgi:pyruvate ferredoxin oxidoreductase alpha subunit
VRLAVDCLQAEGIKAGGARSAMFRPFPIEDFRKTLAKVKHVIVIDRDISFGAEGIVTQEVNSGLDECHAIRWATLPISVLFCY